MVEAPTQSAPTAVPNFDVVWIASAQRVLSRLLRLDYLSGGAGHRVSYRAVAERVPRNSPGAGPAGRRSGTQDDRAVTDSQTLYLRHVAACARLSSSEEYRLAVRMRRGDVHARNALLQANLGLVVMFAQRWRDSGLPMLDLIAEGNLGLLAATRDFDPERGFRFSTYAKWYVRQAISRAVPRLGRLVRLPGDGSAGDDDSKPPAVEPAIAPQASRRLGHVLHDTEPLDELQLAAPDESEPPAQAWSAQKLRLLGRALDALDERQRRIVCRRWGLAGQGTQTLRTLALELGVSIERVRQLEASAIRSIGEHLRSMGMD